MSSNGAVRFDKVWTVGGEIQSGLVQRTVQQAVEYLFLRTEDAHGPIGDFEYRLARVIMLALLTMPEEYRNTETFFDALAVPPDVLRLFIELTCNKTVLSEFQFYYEVPVTRQQQAISMLHSALSQHANCMEALIA